MYNAVPGNEIDFTLAPGIYCRILSGLLVPGCHACISLDVDQRGLVQTGSS